MERDDLLEECSRYNFVIREINGYYQDITDLLGKPMNPHTKLEAIEDINEKIGKLTAEFL